MGFRGFSGWAVGAAGASIAMLSGVVFADDFPALYNSEPEESGAPMAAEEAAAGMQLPDGFRVTVFAAEPDVRNPIAMAWDHRGRLWIAENFTYAERGRRFDLDLRDRLLVFEDGDGDGRADSRAVFADDLQMLTSVEVGRGGVWAMCPPQLLFIPDRDGDDAPDGAAEVVLDGFDVAPGNYHNFANGLRWGPDGWLYGRCGHSCPGNVGRPGAPAADRIPIEGGIWRYQPEKGVFETLTHGTVNPWGHDWDSGGELFFINTVIGHLWHGLPGAHFKESFGSDPNPHVYGRLDMHADHWHFDRSTSWTESRDGKADEFGGGHAHVGMMIYQSDQWPDEWRGRLFTLNLHGLRANVDRLERHGSGFIGRHQGDTFHASDTWFRGIDIQQGPDGSAIVLDWSDAGECHEHTGVHRTSGRIYRISFGSPPAPELSNLLDEVTPDAARQLIRHSNVWFERQLRSRLAALKAGGDALDPALSEALRGLSGDADPIIRLRALWALHAIGETPPGMLLRTLDDTDERLRAWGIRLLTDDRPLDTIMGPRGNVTPEPVPKDQFARFIDLAGSDPSGLVRLTLASTLQRLPFGQRAKLAESLVLRGEDADDHNLPLMVWFGIMPLGESDPGALVKIAEACQWPQTLEWIARRLAEDIESHAAPLNAVLAMAAGTPPARRPVLEGVAAALEGWPAAPEPDAWKLFAGSITGDEQSEATVRDLSALFGDGCALDAIRATALDEKANPAARRAALRALIESQSPDVQQICRSLLSERDLAAVAIEGLARFSDPGIGRLLSSQYSKFDAAAKSGAIDALSSRAAWAAALLEQVAAGNISRNALTAFHARQIAAIGDDQLREALASAWGEVRESDGAKRAQIAAWKNRLAAHEIAAADLSRGRAVFNRVCASCHVLYGEGEAGLGPDLTGSGRADLDYLLENIIDPSASVSIDYGITILHLADGRVLTGVIADESSRTLTLRHLGGELTVPASEIAKREDLPVSMMPESLLDTLQPDEVRDLIAYLQHPRQVSLP